MQPPSRATIENTLKTAGYVWFSNGSFNLNLIALRAIPGTPNRFDDLLCCFWREAGIWKAAYWPCTTDPGLYWLESPGRVDGTAIIKPGQHRGAYKLGQHKGQYECLVPAYPIPVWRDRNKDARVDYGQGDSTSETTQIHRANAGRTSTIVDKWSAGCIVIANPVDFAQLMDLARKQITAGMGTRYTLTLLDWAA